MNKEIVKIKIKHPTDKNKIVEMFKEGGSIILMACRNGHQYSGTTLDEDMLPMVKKAIEDWERNNE